MRTGKRYELRSKSDTSWWRTGTLPEAVMIMRDHGEHGDFIYDTKIGRRIENDNDEAKS